MHLWQMWAVVAVCFLGGNAAWADSSFVASCKDPSHGKYGWRGTPYRKKQQSDEESRRHNQEWAGHHAHVLKTVDAAEGEPPESLL